MQRRFMMLCAGLCALLVVVIGVALADPPPPTSPPSPSAPGPDAAAASATPAPVVMGHAPAVGRWSQPSDNGRYIGGYIGGGSPNFRRAEGRTPDEGTWGWDYHCWFPRRTILGWWHGRRYQGGSGSYRTDGPHYYREEEKG